MRRGVVLAVVLAVGCAASAHAQPVTRRVAHHAISRWWAVPKKPAVEWCVRKRDGTICALYIPFEDVDRFGIREVKGHETMIVWVSRTLGRVRVANLGATVVVNITPVFFRPHGP